MLGTWGFFSLRMGKPRFRVVTKLFFRSRQYYHYTLFEISRVLSI